MDQVSPVQLAGSFSSLKFVGVSAGGSGSSHTCAFTDIGVLYCWGSNQGANNSGKLGNGGTIGMLSVTVAHEMVERTVAMTLSFTFVHRIRSKVSCSGYRSSVFIEGSGRFSWLVPHLRFY